MNKCHLFSLMKAKVNFNVFCFVTLKFFFLSYTVCWFSFEIYINCILYVYIIMFIYNEDIIVEMILKKFYTKKFFMFYLQSQNSFL